MVVNNIIKWSRCTKRFAQRLDAKTWKNM